MNPKIQNKISQAVNRGINLGFDLCDVSFEDDTKITQDLSTKKPGFKDVDVIERFLNKFDILRYLNHEYEKTDLEMSILELLCSSENKIMGIYKVDDSIPLQSFIFRLCIDFGNRINLNWIDVSKRTKFKKIFNSLDFNGDISQWDVSNAVTMRYMFYHSKFNGDISHWNVRNVEDMSFMFGRSKFNRDISRWDVSNVQNMKGMFDASLFDEDISQWDVSSVKNMCEMFKHSKFTGDLSQWDTSHVVDMAWMFAYTKYDFDLSEWDASQVIWNNNMFYECSISKKHKPKFK